MATLSDARKFLSRYAGQSNDFTERLNFVNARLLPEGNWRETKVPARFAVYVDNEGNRVITLPRELETILAGAYQAPDPDVTGPNWYWCGNPIPVRGDWYEYSASGPGNYAGSDPDRGFMPLAGRYTTFCDWEEPMRLRIKVEEIEIAGNLLLRGIFQGAKIYTTSNGIWIEGLSVNFTNTTVTTTQKFDIPPYEIVKSVTKGRIRLYMVDDEDVETIVAYYDPAETNPSYKRWKCPVCEATGP